MNKVSALILILSSILFSIKANAQDFGRISGNVQFDGQYYSEDSLIGAEVPPEKLGMMGFGNINYTKDKFRAGIRYEMYQPALLGYPLGYEGSGIAYKYAGYEYEGLDVTLGNFYEQFGSGLILRSWEERTLGYDNAFDGIRLKYSGIKGVNIKLLAGKQRFYFTTGDGIVRGVDGEFDLNEILNKQELDHRLILGASFVSKYQNEGNHPFLNLPENVASYATRLRYSFKNITLTSEYVYKYNDPSFDNDFNFQEGHAFLANLGYAKRGFAINAGLKTLDNMSFRSNRNATLNDLFINYIPSLSTQHTYNLASTLYPYNTQPVGEFGVLGEVFYKIPKKSKIGGKYGIDLTANISMMLEPNRELKTGGDAGLLTYNLKLLKPGKKVYFRDVNFSIKKKFNKNLKATFTYIDILYNADVNQGIIEGNPVFKTEGLLHAQIGVMDVTYKLNKKNSIRAELQHLSTTKHRRNWATAVVEYTFAPHWSIAAIDQYNYGNPLDEQKIHYLFGSVAYINKTNRIALSYGKQRAGVFCVGGVCRNVPASNGFSISVTSSF